MLSGGGHCYIDRVATDPRLGLRDAQLDQISAAFVRNTDLSVLDIGLDPEEGRTTRDAGSEAADRPPTPDWRHIIKSHLISARPASVAAVGGCRISAPLGSFLAESDANPSIC